jgi:hypothetical protein
MISRRERISLTIAAILIGLAITCFLFSVAVLLLGAPDWAPFSLSASALAA